MAEQSKRKDIVINPITRIEGHAKVTICLSKNESVKEARFHVVDFRGFEKFCEGRPFYEMPSITARSCGICPVSHLLASAKACDEIVGANPPKIATLLRRLIHMGQIIQSHALNFFHLSSPDLLLGMDADPADRNIFGLIKKQPEIALQGIKLRKFGQEIIEKVAGKKIHPSDWILPGGVQWSLKKENADYLLSNLPEALDITIKTISMFKDLLQGFDEEVQNFGNFPSYYMGMVNSTRGLEMYDGKILIVDQDGKIVADQLDPKKYQEYIGEAVEPWSYMKFPYYKPLGYPNGMYRVGPLARLNVASHCGTTVADKELKEFKKLGKNGIVQSSFLYHYARLIEILTCIETTQNLLEEPEILSEHVQAKAFVNNYEGIGVAEAPRGTLIHHYRVDPQGIIKWCNMIIATEHNNLAYNQAVTQVAKKYVKTKQLREGMLNRIEAVIRAFDPCLSCATHAIGKMPLELQLINSEGKIIDIIAR
ncbi:MAG: Ni/Fe hydrogenase subunit alpha [Candidatus Bathyarchaeota archaeon]|nr:Ni/Fe hydrogenase subunit alpha [Candidatus Bathyarchaeum tardum]WGM89843.1 MAG: Ni/Fe hydrogenase subunit alpha [Candidatus Bathyarchaeum tardum]WNZ30018.1 MAG: Ni/Fe hydrogenase subunit alpha [Candidatus Bathyarchaeota archaeon]